MRSVSEQSAVKLRILLFQSGIIDGMFQEGLRIIPGIINEGGTCLVAGPDYTVRIVDCQFAQFHEIEIVTILLQAFFLCLTELQAVLEIRAQAALWLFCKE